ncbi:MAG: dodecin family protein [Planctomycetaceae bacterium]
MFRLHNVSELLIANVSGLFIATAAGLEQGTINMSDHVYKKIEITGSSRTSIEDAIRNAISHAAKTVRQMRWFEVAETRGDIKDGKVDHWQVTIKIGFTLDA